MLIRILVQLSLICCCHRALAASAEGVLRVEPSRQTPEQAALIARIEQEAAVSSAAAAPALLALLDSDAFRRDLRGCCSSLAALGAQALLDLLSAEVQHAELTHNFNAVNGPKAWENDVSVATLANATYFFNLWELAYLGLARPGVQVGGNDVEVGRQTPACAAALLTGRCCVSRGLLPPNPFAEACAARD